MGKISEIFNFDNIGGKITDAEGRKLYEAC